MKISALNGDPDCLFQVSLTSELTSFPPPPSQNKRPYHGEGACNHPLPPFGTSLIGASKNLVDKAFSTPKCTQFGLQHIPRLHLAPARRFDPRGESDSPFSPNVNANHQPREPGLTRLFCPSKTVGFDPRAGSDTASFCSVNRKPSLPRQLIANFRWRSRASFELRFSTHTAHTLCIVKCSPSVMCKACGTYIHRPSTGYIA